MKHKTLLISSTVEINLNIRETILVSLAHEGGRLQSTEERREVHGPP